MENKKPQAPAQQKAPTEPKPPKLKPSVKMPTHPIKAAPISKTPGPRVSSIPKPVAPTPAAKSAADSAVKPTRDVKEQLKIAEQQAAVGASQKSGLVIQPWQLALAVVVMLALITGAVYLGTVLGNKNASDPIVDYTGGLNNGDFADPSGITLPGYSALTFAANSKKVALELPNPTGNPCYFRYTLTIVETGEEIYQSELLAPGKAIETLTLNQALSAGTYTLRIEIDTFSLTDGTTPMNGGVQEVKLTVK